MKCFKFLFIYNKQHKNNCTVDIRGQQRSNRISHRIDKSSHFHEKSPRNSLRKYIYKSILCKLKHKLVKTIIIFILPIIINVEIIYTILYYYTAYLLSFYCAVKFNEKVMTKSHLQN